MRRGSEILGSKSASAGAIAACFAIFALAGCGSSNNPNLKITGISPATIPAGTPGITLVVSGTDFNTGTFFSFGSDSKIAPISVQQQQCQTAPCGQTAFVLIPPNDLEAAGTAQVVATSGGAHSNSATFTIASPQIVTMSPLAVTAGGPVFNLTLEVVNAGQNVEVVFGKDPIPLVPSGQVTCNPLTACAVTVAVPKADIATAGPLTVTVSNPFATAGGTAATNFLVVNPGTATFPLLESANGATPANGVSGQPSTSDGGVYVAFASTATNLPGSPAAAHSEIYLTSNCFGAANCTTGTKLISAGSGGAAGAGGVIGSDKPQISPDGRFVVFESDDTNLTSSGTAVVEQIYLYDSCNNIFGAVKNCTPGITLVSTDGSGNPGNGLSVNPTISAFGLYIAYQSFATNLTSMAVPTATQQVYLFSNCSGASGTIAGCMKGTQLISFRQDGNAGDANSQTPALDPLGMSVAFQSLADNIVSGIASNGFRQVFLRPTCLEGVPFLGPCIQPAVLVSGAAGNQLGTGDSVAPAVGIGPIVVYASQAANLMPKPEPASIPNAFQVLATNLCLGLPATTQCSPSGTLELSVDSSGNPGEGDSVNSPVNGVTAAFSSLANLQSGGPSATSQVYAATVCLPAMAPCTPSSTQISAGGNGIGAEVGSVGAGGFVAFSNTGSSVAPGTAEIFLAAAPPPAGAVTKLRRAKPE